MANKVLNAAWYWNNIHQDIKGGDYSCAKSARNWNNVHLEIKGGEFVCVKPQFTSCNT